MRSPFLALGAIAFATAAACGSAYDEATPTSAGDAGQEADATQPPTGDAAADAPPPSPPRGPPSCPYVECGDGTSKCADETCTDPNGLDAVVTGTTAVADGFCEATSTNANVSSFSLSFSRAAERTHVTLALRLTSVETTDRVIASVSGVGVAWQVVAKGLVFELCEVSTSNRRCTAPVAWQSGDVYLFGILSASNPPDATFGLSVNAVCGADRVLAATHPFAGGDIRGSVGCLDGTAPCVVRFDDALLDLDAE